jgi:methyl-accepting chemotaxis protein
MVKIVGAGLVTVGVLLLSLALARGSFSTMVGQAREATRAHRLSAAVAEAYEQWTLDDDQSNMYAAVVALRDPAQHQLAETTFQQATHARAAVNPALATAQALATTAQERALLQRIRDDLTSYDSFTALMRRDALAGNVQRAIHVVTVENLVPSNDLPLAFAALEAQATDTVTQAAADIDAGAADGNRLLLFLLLAGVLTLLPVFLIGRAIARPLGRLTAAAARLAVGDTTVSDMLPPATGDEIGTLSGSFRAMVGYQQEMSDLVEQIARGDLCGTVQPKSDADVLGHACATMLRHLRALIGQVAQSAQQVDAGAGQLSQTTEQMGQSSTQIARAIEEVARGATEQSRSGADAMARMVDLTAAARQVAGGAEEQRAAVGLATAAVEELGGALRHTTGNVDAVTGAATRAATTAREGGAAVSETIASIESARSAVQQSAQQVQALGQSSAEIGQIVAAIDDIAAQTNLLALNAAIEAARAGEHGKGFTVVAAEVRKLAERSSNETKEITQRIASIQQQVAEVVRAMEVGSAEVEKSATLGQHASTALRDILTVVEETTTQTAAIGAAVTQMTGSVEAVRRASEQVRTVAEQTAQAATQMRSGAERVHVAVESIAAVSEQSAASAEEVSASSQEQTAGIQEMGAGAQQLAALAVELREVVGQFVLESEAQEQRAAGQVAPRRRATDWAPATQDRQTGRRRA